MKKKVAALLLVLCMVVALIPAMALASAAEDTTGNSDPVDTWEADTFTEPTSGTGTADDPILLTSAAEFMWFRNKLTDAEGLTKHYKLTVNVNFKTVNDGFANPGHYRNNYQNYMGLPANTASGATPFSGTFDGDNHIISNFTPGEADTQSLLGIISDGTVKNVTVSNAIIGAGMSKAGGALCYKLTAGAIVENCHLKNAAITGGTIGGIAATSDGASKVTNCTVDATMTMTTTAGGYIYEGGIVGVLQESTVSGCTVSGLLNGNEKQEKGFVGGIVGAVIGTPTNGVTIENCTNNATISGGLKEGTAESNAGFGGVVGAIGKDGTAIAIISGCRNNGTIQVKNAASTGGIIGWINFPKKVTVSDCQNAGTVNAYTKAGGILGYAQSRNSNGQGDTSFTRCLNTGVITAAGDNAGGLIGLHSGKLGNWTFSECANTGNVSGANYVGGLVGQTSTNTGNAIAFINCSLSAVVTATGQYAGLVAGGDRIEQAKATLKIENSVLQGNVKAAGSAAAVVGAVDGTVATPNVTLTKAYVQATVTVGADAQAGTIAGGALAEAITGVNLTVTDSAFAIDVTIGDAKVETPNTYYNYAGEGTVVALDVLSIADLKNGAVVKKLNTGLETALWAQGTNAPELIAFYVAPEVPEIGIDGASLTIGRNVTLNLFIKAATVAEAGVTVKTISIVNNDGETVATGVLNGGTYVFAIEGLKAAEFGANKVYKVQYTTEDAPETPVTCTETITYSPLQYAINMYGKTDKAGLDEMLISLVNYADAAAKNTNASTAFKEKHADADMTRVTAMETIVKEDTGKYTYDAKTMPGISATLTNAIELKVVPNETYTDVTVKVGEEIIEKNGNGAYAFYATDLYNEITFTFTGAEGTEPLTATTSLVQFLNAYAGTDYEAQATATAQYLYAARLFCLNNQPNA